MAKDPAHNQGLKPEANKTDFKMPPTHAKNDVAKNELTSPPEFAWPSQPRPSDEHPAMKKITPISSTRHFSK